MWSVPFIRFLFVGGINTLFSYLIFALFILLGLHYVFASLFAYICGILFNFKTIGTIVFKNKDNRLIFRFFGVYLVAYLVNIGLLKLFDLVGVKSLVAAAIIALPVALFSYSLNRKFVFRGLQEKPDLLSPQESM
jgi:putative flippase GtrA